VNLASVRAEGREATFETRRYLDVASVTKQFGSTVVLKELNLAVRRSEFVSLLGPSGCGKTTLLRLIAGLLKADGGSISIDGRDLTRVAAHKRNIGVVFKNYALFPHLTVEQNVAFGLQAQRVPKAEIAVRVDDALALVRMREYAERRIAALSGGQQQRVAVARAIVGEPALVLADEPTGNLDPQLAIDILGLFEDIHESGTTVLFATHDRTLLDVRPRRVVVLDDGRAVDVPSGLGSADEEGAPYSGGDMLAECA
jgi:ABC-type Fe3+/spermidine/putrescine transport system ATPase subunit